MDVLDDIVDMVWSFGQLSERLGNRNGREFQVSRRLELPARGCYTVQNGPISKAKHQRFKETLIVLPASRSKANVSIARNRRSSAMSGTKNPL